jgi:integrase
MPANPASAVRGPKHVVKTGKTPVLEAEEWRKLLDSIPAVTLRDLRDRALIATLTYSFARINAALRMKVEDLRPRDAAWTIRLHEKRRQATRHALPSRTRRGAARLHRRCGHSRGPKGLAVPYRARARRQVDQKAVDDLILPMWLQVMKGPRENDRVAEEFGKALITAPPPLGSCLSTERTNRKLP